jgi:molybdenum cofactor cytidylyltransferase
LRAVYAVVLAAGRGERFGGDKLLAPWRGHPLLWHALAGVRSDVDTGVLAGGCVVVPEEAPGLERLARDAGLVAVPNRAASSGIGSSIRAGFEWLTRSAGDGAAAAAIFLGDQPAVPPDVLGRLIGAWNGGEKPVVRPQYSEARDQPGHPIVVDRSLWPMGLELTSDAGLGRLLAARGIPVFSVPVTGRNPDVDTPTDLTNLEGHTR